MITDQLKDIDHRDAAKILNAFFNNDPPCNINGMDTKAEQSYWCGKNCGKVDTLQCWEHAVYQKWYLE